MLRRGHFDASERLAPITAWLLFAVLDVVTRWSVYQDLGLTVRLSLVLTPIVILLAYSLSAVYNAQGFQGRFTAGALGATMALCSLSALFVVGVGILLRWQTGSLIPGRTFGEGLLTAGFYYFLIFSSFSFIRFWMVAEAGRHREERRAAVAEADALRSELQRLRLQLNPHFLLNGLNGIGDLIAADPDRARGGVEDMAVFLRHALSDRSALITTVGEEVDVVSAYLGVQSSRFGSMLDVTLDVEAAALARRIAGFLLQPLVENAVEHGRRGQGARVMIRLQTEGQRLRVEVRNPGRLRLGPPAGTGIGLANVRDRLALHYPDRHAFELHEEADDVVAVLVLEGDPCSGS